MTTFRKQLIDERRLRFVALLVFLLATWVVARLFYLQVMRHDYYSLFALNTHEIYKKLHPVRGQIFVQDSRSKQEYPVAINKDFYLIYAVPKDIPEEVTASTTDALVRVLGLSSGDQKSLSEKIAKRGSYAVVAKKVPEETAKMIESWNVRGVYISPQTYRFYPEEVLAAPVIGFASPNDEGRLVGKYGVEGYWEKKLAGQGGFLMAERGVGGGWITLGDRTAVEAQNGADLLLTIDRTLQFKACERLRQGMIEYKAKSGSLVMMNPHTGAVLAMCSVPDFDPNAFSKVDDIAVFNNTAVFTPYEPGSVFKAFTMASALDLGLVSPSTPYTDPCKLIIDGFTVRNALQKCYGRHTMTEALENSINTTHVWLEGRIGSSRFQEYIKHFGFGEKTGVALNTEVAGDISSLSRKGEIFGANGSFGQGLTVTVLQLAAAYSAIANNGLLPTPYVVEEVRYPNGQKEKTGVITERVISERAAKLLSGMLTSVVENHYRSAQIKQYYIAGKTGTAQIAEAGKYSETRTNHTFAGFAPANDPEIVMIVKFEEPELKWAENTTIPVFRDIMEFALQYYGIAGDKK